MELIRKKTFMTLKEADQCGPYDERPMLPEDVDPQLHLSRNDRAQPFYLVCEKDTLIVLVSGGGKVRFQDSSVNYHPAEIGDFIYVPAGTPNRFLPDEPSVICRYKPREPGLEGIAWYCENCNAEIRRYVWDTAETVPQSGYLEHCRAFNASEDARRCVACGGVHETIDLVPYRWAEIGAELTSKGSQGA